KFPPIRSTRVLAAKKGEILPCSTSLSNSSILLLKEGCCLNNSFICTSTVCRNQFLFCFFLFSSKKPLCLLSRTYSSTIPHISGMPVFSVEEHFVTLGTQPFSF